METMLLWVCCNREQRVDAGWVGRWDKHLALIACFHVE